MLLNGKMLTGRDAAHKRIQTMFDNGEGLPEGVDLTNKFIYYVGPVDAVGNEVVGPAGLAATRMDKFTDMMLEQTGLLGMIDKAERGLATVEILPNINQPIKQLAGYASGIKSNQKSSCGCV